MNYDDHVTYYNKQKLVTLNFFIYHYSPTLINLSGSVMHAW